MDKLIVNGPNKLSGTVEVSSSKNATLPILAATILYPGKIKFNKLPKLSDINFFTKILESLGAGSNAEGDFTTIDASDLNNTKADYDLVRKMRASVLVLGPLLSRFGHAEVSLPGGCAIGARPVDIHLKGLEEMGAQIVLKNGYIHAKCDRLEGAHIRLSFPSVGATENLMMAAAYAKGETILENAAQEPEIEDLANFMIAMGFDIKGAGTSKITIQGVDFGTLDSTKEIPYRVIGDRIEAATYIIAALMCDSEITVTEFNPIHLKAVTDTLIEMGAKLELSDNQAKIFPSGKLKGTKVETAPFPGFPTDVQAQLMSLMGIADGNSAISEHIFENRFMHVPELVRMGMDIQLDGHTAFIKGVEQIGTAPVMCTDLRASAALVLTALVAQGETEINRIYHLDRGYQELELKLQGLGAKIKRVRS